MKQWLVSCTCMDLQVYLAFWYKLLVVWSGIRGLNRSELNFVPLCQLTVREIESSQPAQMRLQHQACQNTHFEWDPGQSVVLERACTIGFQAAGLECMNMQAFSLTPKPWQCIHSTTEKNMNQGTTTCAGYHIQIFLFYSILFYSIYIFCPWDSTGGSTDID